MASRRRIGLALWRTLGNVCTRLDGMPPGIELAATRMNALALGTLLRELAGRFHLLTTGARTAPPRHRTLRALIDWSYELLSEPERRVFRRLAVLAGGCTLESARAAADPDRRRMERSQSESHGAALKSEHFAPRPGIESSSCARSKAAADLA